MHRFPKTIAEIFLSFSEISGKGGLEGEEMAAPHHRPSGEVIGGRKVRAPQGRVVRNADGPISKEMG